MKGRKGEQNKGKGTREGKGSEGRREKRGAGTQMCTIIIQISYRLFESYVHHVATLNIPPKMSASSVISVKRC